MYLSDLLPQNGIQGTHEPESIVISGVAEHTAKLKEGMLFIAKRGTRTDATHLLDEIEAKKAAAILLAHDTILPRKTSLPCFYAEDLALAEAEIWERYYGDPAAKLRIFGVTGTNGKTGTAETGQVNNGQAVVHSWFTGYYPVEDPQYVITIFIEDKDANDASAAQVFGSIVNSLACE